MPWVPFESREVNFAAVSGTSRWVIGESGRRNGLLCDGCLELRDAMGRSLLVAAEAAGTWLEPMSGGVDGSTWAKW